MIFCLQLNLLDDVLIDNSLSEQKNEGSFPVISRMAKDFLAIPATSVSVERPFSKSRHICTDLRSSLKEQTIKEALLSKVWIKSGLFKMLAPERKRKRHGLED